MSEFKQHLQDQREDICRRLFDDSEFDKNLTTEVKGLMRQAFNWGVLLERDRIKGVLGKASSDIFNVPAVAVKDLK